MLILTASTLMTPMNAQSAERGSIFPTNGNESLRQQNSGRGTPAHEADVSLALA